MNMIKAALLGLMQGLAEFLPISSSGHLLLSSELFGLNLNDSTLEVFIVLLHVGTLVAVCLCYWRDIWEMICHPLKSDLKWLVLATIPTVVFALTLKDFFDAYERPLLPFAFLFTSIMLFVADYVGKYHRVSKTVHKTLKWYDALSMGLMQCVGAISGVSRSGSTITGGLISGLSRKHAADFSFLMSIPAILGAAVLDLYKMLKYNQFGAISEIGGLNILIGIGTAAVVGFLAIKFMLLLIRRISLKWFSLYTGLLAAMLLVNDYIVPLWHIVAPTADTVRQAALLLQGWPF